MYRYLAIANYEDRFAGTEVVIVNWHGKPSRRKMAAALPLVMATPVGNGKFNLFNSRRIRYTSM